MYLLHSVFPGAGRDSELLLREGVAFSAGHTLVDMLMLLHYRQVGDTPCGRVQKGFNSLLLPQTKMCTLAYIVHLGMFPPHPTILPPLGSSFRYHPS